MKDIVMTQKEFEKYESHLRIPEGKSGRWRIEHKVIPALTPITIISMRTALFEGKKPLEIGYDVPKTYHQLKYDGGIIMSDIPQEVYDQISIAKKCTGRMLVGGLGLGHIATLLNNKKTIKQICIVEKSKDVINLVWRYLNLEKAQLICEDIFKYLKISKTSFDYIYLDTWTGDNEATLYDTVIPLRRLARRLVESRDRILCWREDVMRGQLKIGLMTKIQFPDALKEIREMPREQFRNTFGGFNKVQYPFWNWVREGKVSPVKALKEIESYAELYGDPEWDAKWEKWR